MILVILVLKYKIKSTPNVNEHSCFRFCVFVFCLEIGKEIDRVAPMQKSSTKKDFVIFTRT